MKNFDEFIELAYSTEFAIDHDAALKRIAEDALSESSDSTVVAGLIASRYARECTILLLRAYHEWVSS